MNGTSPPVIFDFNTWVGMYGEFAGCTPAQGQGWFNRASYICGNEPSNPLNCTPGMLSDAIYLLTSHIAWLNAPRDINDNPAATGSAASSIVGRIDQASQGSVSVHAEMGEANVAFPTQAWVSSTKYGAEYVVLTGGVRTNRSVGPGFFLPGQPGFWPGWARGGGFWGGGGVY